MKVQVVCDFNDSKGKQFLYKQVPLNPDQPLQDRQFQVIEKPNIRVYCSDCELDISRFAHIITKNDYYCVSCFASLEVFPQQYFVRQSLRDSPTNSNWDLMDEVVMVNAFNLWGYSNWAQIKEYMDYNGSPFSLAQIQQHFDTYHYKQANHVLHFPEKMSTATSRPLHGENALRLYELAMLKVGELKRRDSKGQKKISSMKVIPNYESESERVIRPASTEQLKEQNKLKVGDYKNQSSVLGYNPKRGEFQYIYYDPDAERMLQELEFYPDDTPEEYELKIKLIQNYNLRLDERARRKQFTLEYKLLDSHYQFSQKPEEQKAATFFQPFMRFTANLDEYRSLIGQFTTLAKYQKFINIFNKIRRMVSATGQTNAAFDYLVNKRRKSIEQWEKAYNKKYKDKKRRKIYFRKSAETLSKNASTQMQEEVEPQTIDFQFYERSLVQFMQTLRITDSMKITPLQLPSLKAPQQTAPKVQGQMMENEQAKAEPQLQNDNE